MSETNVIIVNDDDMIIETTETTIEILTEGIQGPAGPPGSSGGGSSGVVEWVNLYADNPSEIEVCDADESKRLQVANINGLIWIRGMIRAVDTFYWQSYRNLVILPSTHRTLQYDQNGATDTMVAPATLTLHTNGNYLNVTLINFGSGNKVLVYGILGIATSLYS